VVYTTQEQVTGLTKPQDQKTSPILSVQSNQNQVIRDAATTNIVTANDISPQRQTTPWLEGSGFDPSSMTQSEGMIISKPGYVSFAENSQNTKEAWKWVIDSGATYHMTLVVSDLDQITNPDKKGIINANGKCIQLMVWEAYNFR
jgi:hypothetical protein